MLLPSPVKYGQSFRDKQLTEYASTQIQKILVKLRQAKIIDEEQRLDYASRRLNFEKSLEVKDKTTFGINKDNYDSSNLERENYSYENDIYKQRVKEADDIIKEIKEDGLDLDAEPEGEF